MAAGGLGGLLGDERTRAQAARKINAKNTRNEYKKKDFNM
jgi:hypothetical protein